MKSEKLTSFALVIAAVALLIVGAMSYRDYLKAKYEKEFGVAAATGEGARPETGAEAETRQSAVEALPAARPAETPATGAPGQIPTSPLPPLPPGNYPAPEPLPAEISVAADPRISQYQQSLEKLRMENALYRQKLEEARDGGSGAIPPPPVPAGNPGEPSSAVAAATPGLAPRPGEASPEIDQNEVSAMSKRVRQEPSIAKVIEYDHDWAFLILDGGRDRGIEQEMRFAVRRGGEILGWVKITEVEQDRAVAHLMSENKNSRTTRKPARGDEIIAFNLF